MPSNSINPFRIQTFLFFSAFHYPAANVAEHLKELKQKEISVINWFDILHATMGNSQEVERCIWNPVDHL